MKSTSFLNCLSCKNKKLKKTEKASSTRAICGSNASIDGLAHGCDVRINKCNSQNGSNKETLSLSTVSQLNNSHGVLDGRSLSYAADDLDASKVNLLPSESCSAMLKQTSEKNISFENSEIIKRLDAVVTRLERIISPDSSLEDRAAVTMYMNTISTHLAEYTDASKKIDDFAMEQASLINAASSLIIALLELTQKYSKPSTYQFERLLQPLSYKLYEISEYPNKHRANPLYRHLALISDTASILSWPNAEMFAKDVENGAHASATTVMKANRSDNPLCVDWVRSWLRCVTALRNIVVAQYPVGLVWQPGNNQPPIPSWYPPPFAQACSTNQTSAHSSPKRQWKRPSQPGVGEFSYDQLMNDITKSRGLENLRHVKGFSYDC